MSLSLAPCVQDVWDSCAASAESGLYICCVTQLCRSCIFTVRLRAQALQLSIILWRKHSRPLSLWAMRQSDLTGAHSDWGLWLCVTLCWHAMVTALLILHSVLHVHQCAAHCKHILQPSQRLPAAASPRVLPARAAAATACALQAGRGRVWEESESACCQTVCAQGWSLCGCTYC